MNFDLTDEQQMLQAAAREFLAARLKSEKIRALAESDDAFSEDLWREMSDLELAGPDGRREKYGGQELGTIELAVLMEQLGYALAPGPVFSNTLAALALETAATDEQRERWLAPLAAGETARHARALGRGAGWTPADVTLEPERSNGGYDAERREAVRARRRHGRLLHRGREGDGASSWSATPRAFDRPTPMIDAQLGYALAPGPILSSMLTAIALETAATDEQKERYLAPLAIGEQRGTLALWDAGAGMAPDDITLEPEAANGGYVLNGEKLFVLDAATADFFIVGATRRPAIHRRARRRRASRSRRRRRSTRRASSTRSSSTA